MYKKIKFYNYNKNNYNYSKGSQCPKNLDNNANKN